LLLVALYVAVLAAVQATGWPAPDEVASSPAQIADGQLWLLLSSGLVIDGLPWAQLAVLAGVLVIAVRRFGAVAAWGIALLAHVGATLIAYAGVGLLWLADRSLVAGTVDQPDFGVSVILAGEAGALTAAAPTRRLAVAIAAVSAAAFTVAIGTSSALASAEHALGYALGAAVVLARRRR
jgi:hypothetical protein